MENCDENYFSLNKKFFSFEEFETKLEIFQRVSNTQFVIDTCDKLKRGDPLRERFQYQGITYVCKQGKSKHKSTAKPKDKTGNGKKGRPNQRSYKVSYRRAISYLYFVLSCAFKFFCFQFFEAVIYCNN